MYRQGFALRSELKLIGEGQVYIEGLMVGVSIKQPDSGGCLSSSDVLSSLGLFGLASGCQAPSV